MDAKTFKEKIYELNQAKYKKTEKNMKVYIVVCSFMVFALLALLFFVDWGINDLFSLIFFINNNTVYVGAGGTGACYHKHDCRTLWRGAVAISRGEAIAHGKRACLVCNPDSSIIPLIISIIIVLIISYFVFSKIVNKVKKRKSDLLNNSFKLEEADICKKYKKIVLDLLSDENIIKEFKLPKTTIFENGFPILNDYIVFKSKTTNKYHKVDCKYALNCSRIHIFNIQKDSVSCFFCNPITQNDIPKDLERVCFFRNKYEKL